LARRGARNLDFGEEQIGDESAKAQLRLEARKIHVKSLLTAVVLTALLPLVFP